MKTLTLLFLLTLFSISITVAQNYCNVVVDQYHGECRMTNIKFGTNGIDRPSGANEGHIFATETTTVSRGSNIPFSVSGDVGQYCPQQNFKVYIDFNQDYVFQVPAEEVFSKNNQVTGTYQGYISIPATAKLGKTRMRVMNKMIESCGHTPIDPCGTDSYVYHGEVEDFEITISEGTSIKEVLNNLSDFKVYNNNSQIKVEYNLLSSSQVSLNIFNVLGQTIYNTSSTFQNSGQYSHSISLGQLQGQSSIYIIQLVIDNKVVNRKFIR